MKQIVYIMFFLWLLPAALFAEDGSRLWLRYDDNCNAQVTANRKSQTIDIAVNELKNHWKGVPVSLQRIVGIKENKIIDEGFTINNNGGKITISASSDIGLLYGAYHVLRLQQANIQIDKTISEQPKYDRRILNHWDNLDGAVERGFAGRSLWQWDELPAKLSPRYVEYARANASIGINGTVLNNVNASPDILKTNYLQKVKALADLFRPYGITVYLSVNFSSPKMIGGLPTSDPLDKDVVNWWKSKVDEIYALIPDFGGFLVKANSEGQPGPMDFGRTHADGANVLAAALKPHGGIVMWRAFVYNPTGNDRAKQAYDEFMPLDGKFADNVIIQIKNGPIDFQPREPFSPLFGRLRNTLVMPELQITQEYTGQQRNPVYLAPMWKEFFDSDTYSGGKGALVSKITTNQRINAIAGVANIGLDSNWCGSDFAQANWYAFGRLAWNPNSSSGQIADEWLKQTFTDTEHFIIPVKQMMLDSWEACVNYMTPLGLVHLMAWEHHYGPEPWCEIPNARADWLPKYYHKADSAGLGFDRTIAGSNFVAQYHSPLNEQFSDVKTCPEKFLLFFHHVSWGYAMKDGRTMWDELCYNYDAGVQQVRAFQKIWDRMESYVDAQRFSAVQAELQIQMHDAIWWKDACLLYFQTFSKRPIPYDIERPVYQLNDLKKIKLDRKNHS